MEQGLDLERGELTEADENLDAQSLEITAPSLPSDRSRAGSTFKSSQRSRSEPGSRRIRSSPRSISIISDSRSRSRGFSPVSRRGSGSQAVELDAEQPGTWIIYHHSDNLIREIEKPKNTFVSKLYKRLYAKEKVEWEKPKYRINFAELQRMQLRKLQCGLVRDVIEMRCSNKEPAGWESRLQEYVKAMQNYDYMNNCSQRPADPFLVTGERTIDDYVLCSIMRETITSEFNTKKFEQSTFIGPLEGEEDKTPIGGLRHETNRESKLRDLRIRLGLAAVGAAFLVGPMWLMVLHRTLYTALVSTTVFVVLFGVIMAVSLEKGIDVLSSTAAYSAVLVVFVGLNTS